MDSTAHFVSISGMNARQVFFLIFPKEKHEVAMLQLGRRLEHRATKPKCSRRAPALYRGHPRGRYKSCTKIMSG